MEYTPLKVRLLTRRSRSIPPIGSRKARGRLSFLYGSKGERFIGNPQ